MSGEGGLRGRDARGRAKRNLVTVTVCKVSGDRSCVDAADSGAVVDWVGRAVVLQDPRDVMSKGGLEKCKPGPRARVLGDQSVGRVDRRRNEPTRNCEQRWLRGRQAGRIQFLSEGTVCQTSGLLLMRS